MRVYSFFLLCAPVSLLALYNGSPNLPEMPFDNLFIEENSSFSLKANYEGDFVLSRKITVSPSWNHAQMHSMLNGGEISWGFIDRVEIYTLLGSFKTSFSAEKEKEHLHVDIRNSFGGEIGARALAIFWGETKLGFDAKYFYGWPHLSKFEYAGKDLATKTKQANQQEWQVGVSLSQTFAFFTPYVGAKFARFSLNLTGTDLHEDLLVENNSPFGVFVGLGIAGRIGPFLDLEARFLDEYAFSCALGMRF
jgi:hypothetical protein